MTRWHRSGGERRPHGNAAGAMHRLILGVLMLAALLLLFPAPAGAQGEKPRVARGLDIAFVYYAHSGLPVPWTELASHFSEYRGARDEFERHERLAALRPAMERQQAEAARHTTFMLKSVTTIGEYDSGREAFPLGFRTGTFFTFLVDVPGPRFALTFANGEKLVEWRLPRGEAREVAAQLRRTRRVAVEIDYAPVSAREDTLNQARHRIIEARVTAMRFLRPDGRGLIGQVSLAAAAGPAAPVAASVPEAPVAAPGPRPLTGTVEDMLRGNLRAADACVARFGVAACVNTHRRSCAASPPASSCACPGADAEP